MRHLKSLSHLFVTATAGLALSACTEFVDSLQPADNDTLPSADQVTLVWDSPTTRTDGTCLNDQLAGYMVNYQGDSNGVTQSAKLPINSGELSCQQTALDTTCGAMSYSCSHTVTGLETNTWTFAIQAYDNDDRTGPESEAVQITIQ